MKARLNAISLCGLALSLLLAACAPTPVPTPTSLPPTAAPTEQPPTATPTLIPVTLAGPDSGSNMAWLDGSTLVFIPAGEFQMGTGSGDAPVHAVAVDGFWIYKTKVTNRMYAQCVAVGSCTPPTQELGGPVYSSPDYASYPVVGATWDQAQAYCTWAQGRLPTEAEWEKAARGTQGTLYPWGNDDPACDLLNFASCLGHSTETTAYEDGKSPYGLLDMAGNVFEWVADWYDEAYYNNSPSANPTGPESGQYRVVRGSSFESEVEQTLSGIRHYGAPIYHSRDTGFRCAVPQPKPLAPYCQLSAYIPTAQAPSGVCEVPFSEVRAQYCVENFGYTTVDIPDGATYEALDESFACTEAVIDGQRRLTCTGPRAREVTGEITVCNPACSNSPDITGAAPACDPGYTLDPNTGACNYTPILGQANAAGCPAGYVLVDRGGQKSCVVGPGANGLCPQGLYYDSLYGACVPPGGQAEAPYGIDNPDLAAQTFQGCASGYTYDQAFQCCQAQTGGAYPGCAPGSTFNADLGACSPGAVKLSGPGCTTLSVTIPACGQAEDICKRITSETHCLQASYACKWLEEEGICVLK